MQEKRTTAKNVPWDMLNAAKYLWTALGPLPRLEISAARLLMATRRCRNVQEGSPYLTNIEKDKRLHGACSWAQRTCRLSRPYAQTSWIVGDRQEAKSNSVCLPRLQPSMVVSDRA